MNKLKVAGLGAGAIVLAAPLVMSFEGLSLKPYADPVGIPTVCFGETHAEMRNYTPAECKALLLDSLESHGRDIASCVPPDLPDHQKAAALSFGYNVGAEKFCTSTFATKLRNGDPSACSELSRWIFAGGRPLPGLVRRRAAERALCEGS